MRNSRLTNKKAAATAEPAAAPALPRRLKGLAGRTEALVRSKPTEVLALSTSRRQRDAGQKGATTDALPRESIAALYGLATRLHSPSLVYHAKSIETSRAKHVTTEQIWGQMSVLLRPVLRRLQDRVRQAERLYGKAASPSHGAATAGRRRRAEGDTDEASAPESHAGSEEREAHSGHTSDLSESDMDEAIAGLLARQASRRRAKADRRARATTGGGGGDDAWRYALGTGAEEDGEESDADVAEGGGGDRLDAWGDGEDGRNGSDAESDGGRDRVGDRNSRAMRAAMDEDEEGEEAEEMAALKEMYGDDFEDDGEGLAGGADADPELERDLYYDDPSRGDDADGEDGLFDEGEDTTYDEARDGARFWGKDDILREEEALHSYGGTEDEAAVDPTQVGGRGGAVGLEEGGPVDEELERALADPSLTELERERLLEKSHIAQLEQRRLFGTDWAMAGETAARRRPREALLDVDDLEFEYGMKSIPVITEAFTGKLEDRIKQRILDKNFDDVQRRVAFSTADDLVTTRRDAALDSEKSKLSLMDLYEKDYIDKLRLAEEAAGAGAAAAEPLTEIERDELRAIHMWKRLSQHLDALSNFYYTPKPVQQDLDARVRAVDGAAPAIMLETVGNFATSRESALAPQDLYRGSNRRFADAGSAELLPEERRALRRAKKEEGKKFVERKEHRKQAQSTEDYEQELRRSAAAATSSDRLGRTWMTDTNPTPQLAWASRLPLAGSRAVSEGGHRVGGDDADLLVHLVTPRARSYPAAVAAPARSLAGRPHAGEVDDVVVICDDAAVEPEGVPASAEDVEVVSSNSASKRARALSPCRGRRWESGEGLSQPKRAKTATTSPSPAMEEAYRSSTGSSVQILSQAPPSAAVSRRKLASGGGRSSSQQRQTSMEDFLVPHSQ